MGYSAELAQAVLRGLESLWQLVNNPLFGTLVGAFTGATLGYRYSSRKRRTEMQVKRTVLFKLLLHEADYGIVKTKTSYSSDGEWPTPIRSTAVGRLLDGETLDYVTYSDLIKALLELDWYISLFNNTVQWSNFTVSSAGTSAIESVQPTVDKQFKWVGKAWVEVAKYLPQDLLSQPATKE